jgi:hypothetical protein
MQPARPGTVDTGQHRLELQGESMGDVLEARFKAETIEPLEGLYLLENRLLEVGDARVACGKRTSADDAAARNAMYVALKGCVDVATAVLVAGRGYTGLRSERMKRFNSDELQAARAGLLPEGAVEFINDSAARINDLQDTLAGPVDSGLGTRVESLLVDAWTCMARRLFKTSADVGGLIEIRATGVSQSVNVREFMAMGKRLGHNRLRLAIGALPTSRVSPVDALRMAGLLSALAVDSPVLTALDRLTKVCGFDNGTVLERARAMRFALERT